MSLCLIICLFVFPGQLIYVIKRNNFKIFSLASLKGQANKNLIRKLLEENLHFYMTSFKSSQTLTQTIKHWMTETKVWLYCSLQLYDHMHVAKQSCVLWNDHKWLTELKSWAMCLLRFVSSPPLCAKKSTTQYLNILFCCVSDHKSITGSLPSEGWPFAICLKCTVYVDWHAWTAFFFFPCVY